MKHALEARTISVETHEPLFDEVAEWQQWKSQQYSATSASGDSDDRSFIRVSLLASSYRISINANTTVKDVKVELGRLIDRNPPSIRLMFHGTDVKVLYRCITVSFAGGLCNNELFFRSRRHRL